MDPQYFPEKRVYIGIWLGVAHNVGQGMCYYILKVNGQVIVHLSVTSIAPEKLSTDDVKSKISILDRVIQVSIGDYEKSIIDGELIDNNNMYTEVLYLDDDVHNVDEEKIENEIGNENGLESENSDSEIIDKYIGVKALLPRGDGNELGLVTKRKRDSEGHPIGHANSNPIIDTSVYTVKFCDCSIQEYTENNIAESLYSQIDDEGAQFALMDEIINHRTTKEAVAKADGYTQVNRQERMVIKTHG